MPRISKRSSRNYSCKKIQRGVSRIETLPNDLVIEVLARVAASSTIDIINAKLSCKTLKEIGEDSHVYHHVSLDKLCTDSWPLSDEQQAFLNNCLISENPESLYRQAVVDYFNGMDLESAGKHLHKAMKSSHIGALYVTCIILILNDDDEFKHKGIEIISNMQKSASMRREMISQRRSLMQSLKGMWVKNPILNQQPMIFCNTQHRNRWRSGWRDMDAKLQCQACCADREIGAISGFFY